MCAHHSSPLVEAQSYRRGDWHIGRLEALPRVGIPTTFCQFPRAADSALIASAGRVLLDLHLDELIDAIVSTAALY
jgi:hypothetical protein